MEASAALVGAIKEVSAQVASPNSPKKATTHRLLGGLRDRVGDRGCVSSLLEVTGGTERKFLTCMGSYLRQVTSEMFSQDALLDATLRRTLHGVEEETAPREDHPPVTAHLLRSHKGAKLEQMTRELSAKYVSDEEGDISEAHAAKRVEEALRQAENDVKCDGSMYCVECRLWFPGRLTPNRKHCWSCNKCVTGFDHHCK